MDDNIYRRVRFGLVGAGDFGMIYAHILKQLPNVELVSVFSADEKSAKRASELM